MEVRVSIHKTPQPSGREDGKLIHARVQSKGTRRLDDIIEKIVPLGLNTAQLKAILDGLAVYIGESLRDGYHIELDEIGTFSLSVKTKQVENKGILSKTTVEVDGVNFKCSKKLKTRAQQARLMVSKKSAIPDLPKRKNNLVTYLKKHALISIRRYSSLNNCSTYQATKDIRQFELEGLIIARGRGRHKVYLLS